MRAQLFIKNKVFLFLIGICIWTCSTDEFEPDNPLDPGNPTNIPPTVEIISGPSGGSIVTSSSVTFGFTGNESSMEFRSKLDTNSWLDWSSAQSVTFDYLDDF